MELTVHPVPIQVGTNVRIRITKESDNEPDTDLIWFAVRPPDEIIASGHLRLQGPSAAFEWVPTTIGPVVLVVLAADGYGPDHDWSDLELNPSELTRTTTGDTVDIRSAGAGAKIPVLFAERLNVTAAPLSEGGLVRVQLQAPEPLADRQGILDRVIEHQTNLLTFDRFDTVATDAVCDRTGRRGWYGEGAYRVLRNAALRFIDDARGDIPPDLQVEWDQFVGANGAIPYVDQIEARALTRDSEDCPPPLELPGTELIWSFYQELGALVQTMNHVVARFQNRRVPGHDPLNRFDLSPLLPLRNLLWGFAEDEYRRLTVRRRAAEYHYEYGLRLIGRAVPAPDTMVESRTRFLESFNSLLHIATQFYRDTNDLTIRPDPFPVLNALRETHLILAQGAHNQFADLARRARAEMLSMQWMLARPEVGVFLGGRPSVPYQEPWMDRVDTVKSLFGWTDVTITHFRDLAFFGEKLVLSIRLGDWNDATLPPSAADSWARTWRNAVQRYVHAYRAVTGADLTDRVDATTPALLLARRSRPVRA